MKQLILMLLYEKIIEPIIDFFLSETTKRVFLAVVSTIFYFCLATIIFSLFYAEFKVVDYGYIFPLAIPVFMKVHFINLLIFWAILCFAFFIFYHAASCFCDIDEPYREHQFLDDFDSIEDAFIFWPFLLLLGPIATIILITIGIVYGFSRIKRIMRPVKYNVKIEVNQSAV